MKRLASLIGSSPGPMGVTALAVTACALTVPNGGFNALPSADDTSTVRPQPLTGIPLERSAGPCPASAPTSAKVPAGRLHPVPTSNATPPPAPRPNAAPTHGPTPTAAVLGTLDCAQPAAGPGGLPSPATPGGPPGPATPGAASIGDPYFPQSGNGGYDATDYDVNLRFQPKDKSVDAMVTITATALQSLSAFDLDYAGPEVSSVTVDGEPASYRRTGPKLVITPRTALRQGDGFTTVVHYAGIPGPAGNPDLGTYGWVPTRDGVVVTSEPDGAPTWLPVNDHPSDKATYTFHVTVPADLQVLANGVPDAPVSDGVSTTYVWHERMPMASYLASIAIGHFKIRKGTAGGIPLITAVDPKFQGVAARLYDTTAAAVTWGSSLFGPYPFSTAGGIVDDARLDYALETQERPIYAGFAPDDDFIVHELAHQWFGDSVSLTTWKDIWLNEGFATYAEWLWHERTGKDSARKTFRRYYEQPTNSPLFSPPPARPGRQQLFSFSVYIRGAMCLQALRDRVGSATFFKILRTWAADHQYGNATTAQFEALAEQLSGQRLDRLFDAWLNGRGKPRYW